MNFRSNRKRGFTDVVVDLTPLIDVVFLLLIFFTLTTSFVTVTGFEVELPKANSSSQQTQQNDLVVAINQEGQIIFQNLRRSEEELAGLMEELLPTHQAITVIVQADASVLHGRVVQIMDLIRSVGYEAIAVATQEN